MKYSLNVFIAKRPPVCATFLHPAIMIQVTSGMGCGLMRHQKRNALVSFNDSPCTHG